jgi:heptaprenyl diphosphate synthase
MAEKKRVSGRPEVSPQTRRTALIGVLTALALALSALELMIPALPMLPPGAKLGLSNLATMYAAGAVGLGPALAIAVGKALFAGLTRGFTAMVMSLAGGTSSTLVMWLLLKRKRQPFGLVGLGVAGALTHNAAQLLAAAAMTTPAVIYYVPWLIIFGVLTGILTGLVLKSVLPLLNRISPQNPEE